MKKKLLLGLLSLMSLNAFANNSVLEKEFDEFYKENKTGIYITTCFKKECFNTYYDLNTNEIQGKQLEKVSYEDIRLEKTDESFDWLTLDFKVKEISNFKIHKTNVKRKVYKEYSQKLRVTEDYKLYFETETKEGVVKGFLTVNQKS